MRDPTSGLLFAYPCGQCTPCRIRRKSCWTLRNILESQHAVTSSFWTLTLSEQGMLDLASRGPRALIRSFMDALRKSESRQGNSAPIRYFGALEFGGTFGRPHFHMLLYNLVANYRQPVQYQRGLPRPQLAISLWPHGSVDIGEHNLATMNYTIEYLTKAQPDGSEPLAFKSIKPPIGFSGLVSQAAFAAMKLRTLPGPLSYLMIGTRRYPLDKTARDTFCFHFRRLGGVYQSGRNKLEKKVDRLLLEEAERGIPRIASDEVARIQRYETLGRLKDEQKAAREQAITAIYEARRAHQEPGDDQVL